MELKYEKYAFTPILGWSLSRFELFDKCRRQYFYNYYSKFAADVPQYKMTQLKSLTSTALEVGNVVHDVLEAFLLRLQKSPSNIDEKRFFEFAETRTREYFTKKTFIEVYYGRQKEIDVERAIEMVNRCLHNFINAPIYSWIFMKAIRNRENWMIEPPGYGETRLDGMKAYCKMDFLFPVEDDVIILDWKTGKKDTYKHRNQLIGYAAAAHANFQIPWNRIFPKIIYLSPEFEEYELPLTADDFNLFFGRVKSETAAMQALCKDIPNNVPMPEENFPMMPEEKMCGYCNYQELCFPEKKNGAAPSDHLL